MGFSGRFIFVLLQFLQVTFLPIPSTVSTLAGVLIYGPLETALLSLSGIILGSVFAFFLGRHFGRKLVVFMVGEQTCEKWVKFLSDAKYSFFIMMILPIFPDDVLCLVAGLTDMSWKFFVLTNLVTRPFAIFTTCYIGSGQLIPYHGWGLIVWAVIIVVVVILLYLSFRYKAQIENFLKTRFKSKKQTENVECAKEEVSKLDTTKEEQSESEVQKAVVENQDKNSKGLKKTNKKKND